MTSEDDEVTSEDDEVTSEVVKTTEMAHGGKGIRVGSVVCQKMDYVPQEIFLGISKVRDVVFSPTHK